MSSEVLNTKADTSKRSRGKSTREALVESALVIFARDGYHAASTRDIADAANTNQALINYHFKGKQGLYLAVFEHISQQATQGLGGTIKNIQMQLEDVKSLSVKERSEFALTSLEQITTGLVHMMSSELTKDWSSLIMREQQHPTAAFDIMNKGFMGKLFCASTQLIAMAKNIDSDSEQARLLSILLFGQILVLKVSRATVLHHMQWDQFSEPEIAIAEKQVNMEAE